MGLPDQLTGVAAVFGAATSDIDSAFKVSNLLRDHFVSTLDNAAKSPGLTNTQQTKVTRGKQALENIKGKSIAQAEEDVLVTLYHFGIISIASVAEQLMKSIFNDLLINNLEIIRRPEKFSVSLADLKERKFEIHKSFWVDQIMADLYGTRGGQDKLNFQNVKAVESLLRDYFSVNLADAEEYDEVSKRVHLYYQIRHVLTHNGGIIDERFRHNLEVAGIPVAKYINKEYILLSRHEYEECRDSFMIYFAIIEAQIRNRGLELDLG